MWLPGIMGYDAAITEYRYVSETVSSLKNVRKRTRSTVYHFYKLKTLITQKIPHSLKR